MVNVNRNISQPAVQTTQASGSTKAAKPAAKPQAAGQAAATPAQPASIAPKDSVKQAPAQGSAAASLSFDETPAHHASSIERLKEMKPADLVKLGKTDKKAFFAALLPAALESERKYGVPAEVTLAQAALESGWGKHGIGGYNIFGIKGSGPAGTVSLATKEGSGTASRARFAKFNNYHEAIVEHGQMFNNGSYTKGMNAYAKDKNPMKFTDNIAKAYATAPNYASQVKSIITKYGLQNLANQGRNE